MRAASPRRVVLAPDKFKGTLSARDVADAMRAAVPPRVVAVDLPIADGGDGSVDAALSAGWSAAQIPTTNAWNEATSTTVACRATSAIVEVATICGLGSKLPTPEEAARATSFGVGTVLSALLDDGVDDITLALGGSAVTDGGAGLLRALGLRLLDADGNEVAGDSRTLATIATVDRSGLDDRLADLRLSLACDVDTPMVGPDGSAEMFAGQKGADPATIELLSVALRHLAHQVEPHFTADALHLRPGSGAAGGLAWAGLLLGGRCASGATTFLSLLNADENLRDADLVITGEGRLDEQSLRGKGPCAIAELANSRQIGAVAVVGHNDLANDPDSPFLEVVAIDQLDPTCVSDIALARELIAEATRSLLARHLPIDMENGNHT